MAGHVTAALRTIGVELGPRRYDIVVGSGVLGHAAAPLAGRARVAVVSQPAIAELFAEPLVAALHAAGTATEVFLMGDGEEAKSLTTVESLCRRFAAWGLLRGDAVVALGGGVVGDTAGFTAAAYHRGVACLQAPTTLLAQVDAAIGGKTGVNLPEGKNLVGAFHQPLAVLCDVDTLATLPEREYRAGLGEVAKYAFMGDAACPPRWPTRPPPPPSWPATRPSSPTWWPARRPSRRRSSRPTSTSGPACGPPSTTATRSPTPSRPLGHYGLLHGEAVAVGLVFATELAAGLDRLPPDAPDATRRMLGPFGLPTAAPDGLAAADLITLMRRDKKAAGGLTFVLPAARRRPA